MDEYIKFDDAIRAMDELEKEDIEAYGCKILEGFDGERARLALCLLPRYKIREDRLTGEVLEDIEAEIRALPKKYPFVNHLDSYVKDDDVIKIIDKHITQMQ